MFEAINTWLERGCNYLEGVGLYQEYGTNTFLKGVFSRGETPANRQKLNELLVELRDNNVPAIPAPAPEASIVKLPATPLSPIHSNHTEATIKPLPALLQVTQQRDKTYAELRGIRPYIHTEEEGEPLRVIAERLVRLSKKNAELWERYNYLTEHDGEPEPDQPAPAPPVMIDLNLVNKREQLRKNLSKALSRKKKQVKPKPKTLELIDSLQLQINELDEKIAAIKKEGVS